MATVQQINKLPNISNSSNKRQLEPTSPTQHPSKKAITSNSINNETHTEQTNTEPMKDSKIEQQTEQNPPDAMDHSSSSSSDDLLINRILYIKGKDIDIIRDLTFSQSNSFKQALYELTGPLDISVSN
jgi:hypothetical protein